MIAMSNLGDTLIILDQKAIEILLKIWLLLRKFSTTSNVIGIFMFYMRYGKLIILKYDFDWNSQGASILSALIWFEFLIYFSVTIDTLRMQYGDGLRA